MEKPLKSSCCSLSQVDLHHGSNGSVRFGSVSYLPTLVLPVRFLGQNLVLGWFWADWDSGFELCVKNCIY